MTNSAYDPKLLRPYAEETLAHVLFALVEISLIIWNQTMALLKKYLLKFLCYLPMVSIDSAMGMEAEAIKITKILILMNLYSA